MRSISCIRGICVVHWLLLLLMMLSVACCFNPDSHFEFCCPFSFSLNIYSMSYEGKNEFDLTRRCFWINSHCKIKKSTHELSFALYNKIHDMYVNGATVVLSPNKHTLTSSHNCGRKGARKFQSCVNIMEPKCSYFATLCLFLNNLTIAEILSICEN